MALLARVKERIESKLSDPELQLLIDEALGEIIRRHGPNADPTQPITVTLEGRRQRLSLVRPIDEAEALVVAETVALFGEVTTVLNADDYRLWHGGRTLERRWDGTNPRYYWGDRVAVTYTPVNDGNQRQEVAIKLVQLAVEYKGVTQQRVGDTATTYGSAGGAQGGLVYSDERERVLRSLGSGGIGGLFA